MLLYNTILIFASSFRTILIGFNQKNDTSTTTVIVYVYLLIQQMQVLENVDDKKILND